MKIIKFLWRYYVAIASSLAAIIFLYAAGFFANDPKASPKLHWILLATGFFFLLTSLLITATERWKSTASRLFDAHALPKNMTYIVERREELLTSKGTVEIVIVRAIEVGKPDIFHVYQETGETRRWKYFGKSLSGRFHQYTDSQTADLLKYRNELGTDWHFGPKDEPKILELLSKYEQ